MKALLKGSNMQNVKMQAKQQQQQQQFGKM